MTDYRLYHELAPWFRLLTPPADYADEAEDALARLEAALGRRPATLLELGSGGGHLVSHLVDRVSLCLSDLSPAMIASSRALNPGVEHVVGDMRSIRLGRTFDAVLIHDAVMYMTTREDLVAAFMTARAHLGPGGVLLVLPDCVAETYRPGTEASGTEDADGHGLRYLEWTHPVEPGAARFVTDLVVAIRDPSGGVSVHHDRHVMGLFPRATWMEALREAGFTDVSRDEDLWRADLFLGRVTDGR